MKIIRKNKSALCSNSGRCKVHEYGFCDSVAGIAVAQISGRYPESGFVVNEVCKEIAYVISGNGKAGFRKGEANLSIGDAVLIEKGDEYFWKGDLSIVIFSVPAWTAEQCRYYGE